MHWWRQPIGRSITSHVWKALEILCRSFGRGVLKPHRGSGNVIYWHHSKAAVEPRPEQVQEKWSASQFGKNTAVSFGGASDFLLCPKYRNVSIAAFGFVRPGTLDGVRSWVEVDQLSPNKTARHSVWYSFLRDPFAFPGRTTGSIASTRLDGRHEHRLFVRLICFMGS